MVPKVTGRAYRSAWKIHKEEWGKCTKCPLHEFSHHRVLVAGSLPCDILFIGESPNKVEDITGLPFLGPAGGIIHQMIKEITVEFTYAMTKLIACMALDKDESCRPPNEDEVASCSDRLYSTLMMARPSGIVVLGDLVKEYSFPVLKKYKNAYNLLHLSDPPTILHQGGVECDLYRIELDRLNDFIEETIK